MKIVKRFLVILFYMCFICITTSAATGNNIPVIDYTKSNAPSLFWQEVENLIKQNESEIAYSQIAMLLKSKYSLEHIQKAVQNAERHFNHLHQNNTNFKKSIFNVPKTNAVQKKGWESVCLKYVVSPVWGVFSAGKKVYNDLDNADKKNYDEAVAQKFPFVDKDKANATLLQYDIIKKILNVHHLKPHFDFITKNNKTQ